MGTAGLQGGLTEKELWEWLRVPSAPRVCCALTSLMVRMGGTVLWEKPVKSMMRL